MATTYTYLPYQDLDGVANIIVDGRPHPDSVLVLSHWKGSGTPASLMRDTSAQTVLESLTSHPYPSRALAVSNNHFDQDGLVGIFSLLNQDYALAHKDFLIDIAEAGDFAKFKNREAARVTFVIAKLLDKETGFFEPKAFALPYLELTAIFYRKFLSILPDIIERLPAYEAYWSEEDQFLEDSENLIRDGLIQITELENPPLAIVEISPNLPQRQYHWANQKKRGIVHDMAIHNNTDRALILYKHGKNYWFNYRYETWVQFVSKRHPARVDLQPLSEQLNLLEGDVKWSYTGSDDLTPMLSCKGESSLSFESFTGLLFEALRLAPVNWDPFYS
jgi:hypothetical protein